MHRAIALALCLGLAACGSRDAPLASLEVAEPGAFSAALSPDGRQAVIGSLRHGGSLWELDTDQRRFNWNHRAGESTPITVVAFAPGGDAVMTASHDTLVLWDTASGGAITYFTAPAKVNAIALGPGGRLALLGLSDDTAVLFDARKGGIRRVFAHEGRVRSVALDADARLALSGSEDRSARLWDVASGAQLQRWQHDADVRLVALAPDGSRALSVSKYDRAVVWDTSSGRELGALPAFRARVTRGETVDRRGVLSRRHTAAHRHDRPAGSIMGAACTRAASAVGDAPQGRVETLRRLHTGGRLRRRGGRLPERVGGRIRAPPAPYSLAASVASLGSIDRSSTSNFSAEFGPIWLPAPPGP
ncbi:MAG: hypothetical protein IPM40_08245 [Gammaproteobacteria bacterium]|nr:hypothetical protein [Gammaproteobacteria bacterium]